MKQWLLGMSIEQLKEVARQVGLRPFAAGQIARWIYQQRVDTIDQMTNISLDGRARMSEHYQVGGIGPSRVETSKDGTRKYLLPTIQGHSIESVYIPDRDRATLCVSSQAGCRMGCRFCMTGRQGLQDNLTSGEIINQIFAIDESASLTNVVFMGMGEPLDNMDNLLRALEIITAEWGMGWSPSRITVSTIGVIPAMRTLLEQTRVHLAVSLHNPFDDERAAMMPIQKAYPAADVIDALRDFDFSHQRRLSFEYIMFAGRNDTSRHVNGVLDLLRGLDCRVNLIRFHAIPDSDLCGSSPERIYSFNGDLNRGGIVTTTRSSRGEDIMAACGMLSSQDKNR